jgi:bacterioferritin-associated ferredoxin
MVVCHCSAVTDSEVKAAIEDGARTLADVARRCGAAKECGGCRFAVKDLIEVVVAEPGADPPARHDGRLTVTAAA